jgi:ring-1,2-phenylacetyl-CoA epoxidase subunit PaaD
MTNQTVNSTSLKQEVRKALQEVKDPEIPKLSVLELGMITGIEFNDAGVLTVKMTPTFAACPAINYIQQDIKKCLEQFAGDHPEYKITDTAVKVNYDVQWTSDRVTETGRKKLKEFGLTPPPAARQKKIDKDTFEKVECPNCGSENTTMKSSFGSTLCRAIHYCKDCKEGFEQFKPV